MKLVKNGFCVAAVLSIAILYSLPGSASASENSTTNLPVQYEELTAPDFIRAVKQSAGTCIIPIGIMEKHGPHLPLGTDMLDIREVAVRAAHQEYCIIFPEYYFGQIYEAKHQPGTLAYSPELVWNILQETCDELARNGIKKIILVNGHGGNNSFLPYFCQSQLAQRKDYAVILFRPQDDPVVAEKVKSLRKTTTGGHAGETETSTMLVHRPDLVHVDRAKDQSGQDQQRLENLRYGYTGIWWYAKYPNHYAGDGSYANRKIGELLIDSDAGQLAELVKVLKTDDTVLKLQQRFYNEAEKPLETKQ